LTRLFGRDAEVAELAGVVERTRLVTFVGAAGCGKTRLAIEVGERLADRFPGGVWFVDLAPITDGASVPHVIGGVLGVREEPGQAMERTLVAALASSADPALVVLDNCEHVVDAVAALVERLVGACPVVRVVATSRLAFGLPGEQVWDVVPLPVEPAVELFVDRAHLVSSRFDLAGTDVATVEEICRRLGGLPLAIELAAASTRLLSVGQILDRLARALPLAAGGPRAGSPRHETMSAAVEWSVRLLAPAEQRLFERLSVFAGGFDLAAAEVVVGEDDEDDDDVLHGLTTLVGCSLVVAEPVPGASMRYRLLEPVRQYAAGGLVASGDGEPVRHRHAEHYLALASRFDPLGTRPVRPTVPLARVEEEEGNLLAALHWARTQPSDLALRLCEALAAFWEFGGRLNQGRAVLGEVLAAGIGTTDGRLRVRALGWAGRLAWRQGDYDGAWAVNEERLDLARRLGDTRGCAATHASFGLVAFSRGDADVAGWHCQQSISLAREVGEEGVAVWALVNWGWARFAAGDGPGGEEKMRDALHASRAIGNMSTTAQALLGLQFGAVLRGDVAAQRARLTDALAAMRDGGAVEPSDWLAACGTLALVEGRSGAALRLLGAAEAFVRQRGTQRPPVAVAATADRFDRVRRELGRAVAERLAAEGAQMGWDELVAVGLAEPSGDEDRLLTRREHEVVELVAEGLPNPDIARKLHISRRTVESHIDHIRRKLGLRNRQEILIWALREPKDP
jgi:predicted ATPase/DNA-binding CsgD family transcriptional regulator